MPTTGGLISVTLTDGNGTALLKQKIATYGVAITDLTVPMTEIGEDFLADFALNMVVGGGIFMDGAAGKAGGKWPPLKPSTIREKQRLGFGAMPIMWRTGELAESLAERTAAGNIFNVTKDSVQVGTSIYYAQFHQDGAPSRNLPRRMLIGLSRTMQQKIVKRIADYAREQAVKLGLTFHED